MMEELRYGLALFLLLILPIVIAFWCVIHGGVAAWRRAGPTAAYVAGLIVILIVVTPIIVFRDALVGPDLGTSWPLFLVGAALYGVTWPMSRPIRKHLTFRTFAGVPEIQNETMELLTEGPYAVVRHPRYFIILVGVIGWAFMCNYVGAYAIAALFVPAILAIISLEERELVARFGAAYRDYQSRTPPLFPTLSALPVFFGK